MKPSVLEKLNMTVLILGVVFLVAFYIYRSQPIININNYIYDRDTVIVQKDTVNVHLRNVIVNPN